MQTINNNQSQQSLQLAPLNKHQSVTANHMSGKPDKLSWHATMKPDKLCQFSKCRQAIPAFTTKGTVYKGMLEPRTVDKQWISSGQAVNKQEQQSQCYNTTGT